MSLLGRVGKTLKGVPGTVSRLIAPRRRGLSAGRIIQSLQRDGFESVRARYAELEAEHDLDCWTKFFDLERWVPTNLDRARFLGLDYGRSKRILDIGCGVGYFLYICRWLGHEAVGLDIDATPGFNDMVEQLGLDRVVWRVEPFTPLPELGGRFDLITAHMVTFHKYEDGYWGVDEWNFFLDDILSRLAPKGRLFLQFNSSSGTTCWSPGVVDVFSERGGAVRGEKVFLDVPSARPSRR